MTTAVTIPHVLGEATLGEPQADVRGQLVHPEGDGYEEARAIETPPIDGTPRWLLCR
jgi:hypothetical protein